MTKTVFLMIALAAILPTASVSVAQTAPPAYVNENPTDPAPLKLNGVEGVVRGLGGDPMSRASVGLFSNDGHTLVASAMTDKDGKFHFEKVEKGLYRVVARVE